MTNIKTFSTQKHEKANSIINIADFIVSLHRLDNMYTT